ncbi:MAG: LPS export ABC transporter periplasmic protein LptC [Desulfobacterota bacterium]|nr:LPS export ABC transporter periplasmic protein LptC [Thermodesulfobacteriota bacterium]
MNRFRFALFFSILVLAGLVTVILWMNLRDRKHSEEKMADRVSTEGADQRMEKVHLVEEKAGKKIWELEAKAIAQYESDLHLQEVRAIYYAKDGRSFTLTGDRAKVHQERKDMEISGNVLLLSSDGYRLKTRSISYRHGERRAETDDFIEFEGEGVHLTGKGMRIDLEEKTFKVFSQVRTVWKGKRQI